MVEKNPGPVSGTDPLRATLERLRNRPPAPAEVNGDDAAERARREQAVLRLAHQLGPRYAPGRVQPDGFELYHPDQGVALAAVKAFADGITARVEAGDGLLLHGPVGTGKDRLLAWLLYRAAWSGYAAAWVNGQTLFAESRDAMDTGRRESEFLAHWTAPRVLGISDPLPPAGAPSAWNLTLLGRLLDERYRALRPTWFTLNVAGSGEAERKLSAPVFDRIIDGAEVVPCFWPSYRKPRSGMRE